MRRIRNLKCCAQACGCNITTPRYALQFASTLHLSKVELCRLKTLQSSTLLKRNVDAKCSAYLGVVMLQLQACTQR